MTNSIRNSLNSVLTTCLLASLSLVASCGGGGGNGQPNPDPQFPDPVTEISSADFGEAGIPSVASLATSSTSRAASLQISGDFNNDGAVDASDFKQAHNFDVLQGGSGLVTNVPDSENKRRIIAWALYELPAGTDSHLAWLENHFEFADGNVRFFYAMANAGAEAWEIGGALDDNGLESRHLITDGTSNTLLNPNFRRSFSMSQNYVFPNGKAYGLLVAGHSGNDTINGISLGMDSWQWHSISGSIEQEFEQGLNGSCQWVIAEEGGGLWNSASFNFSYIEQDTVYKQYSFSTTIFGHNDGLLLFAQPMNILEDGKTDSNVTNLGIVDAADYTVWLAGFFNPGEMNGWQHPFTLQVDNGGTDDLNVAPLLDVGNTGQPNGIIAILIGLLGQPVEGATVQLISAEDQISLSTGKAGVMAFPDVQSGSYQLQASWTESGQQQTLSYQIDVDTERGIYRFQ